MYDLTRRYQSAQEFINMVGEAHSQADLDRAAQQFARMTSEMARDGVLAAAAGVAARVAPGVTGRVDDVLQRGVRGASETAEGLRTPTTEAVTPDGVRVPVPERRDALSSINDPMLARAESRINIRRGDGSSSSGMEYAWRRHGGEGTSNKSQFSISRAEVEGLLQRRDVVASPVRLDANSGSYIREVDVGRIVGNTPLLRGGHPTSVITIMTDDAGNLINVFPGRLDFGATLP